MDYKELLDNYNNLLNEVDRLSKENNKLKEKLGITLPNTVNDVHPVSSLVGNQQHDIKRVNNSISAINNNTNSVDKINIFMSLFKGRRDVYAKRWDNPKNGKSGYSPVCINLWKRGLCIKPQGTCSKCENTLYAEVDTRVIENHLRGNIVAGIYPMLSDETCFFLAIDFDDDDWQKDISAVRNVCEEFNIPIAVERSRSGNGGHMWFFFENSFSALLARKFGTAILTYAMNKRHEIKFKSYDRLFPSQDTLPKGGLGNLISLPLQKHARKDSNSEFVDEHFVSFDDQWAFLSTIQKISEFEVEKLIVDLCDGNDLGELKTEEDVEKPWDKVKRVKKLKKSDFPQSIEIVKANMLFIPKAGISSKALNRLKRLASFKNPQFYKNQAMRLPTYGLPRIITCADETSEYLCLPRGCEDDLSAMLLNIGIDVNYIDKTNIGRPIKVEFNGTMRDEQALAFEKMLENNTGILSGTTAFGKTVVGIKLIAEKKINTLILVDKVNLLSQWEEKLSQFLVFKEKLSETKLKKRRKKSIIGQLGAGKNTLNGIVDIAIHKPSRRG